MRPFYENKDHAVQSFESVNMEFPEHLHDHVEILYVRKGRITVQIMEKRQELKEGDCAVVFPQQIHSYHAPADCLTRLFIFEDSLTGMYLRSLRECRPASPFLEAEKLAGDGVLALDRLYDLSHTIRRKEDGASSGAEEPGISARSEITGQPETPGRAVAAEGTGAAAGMAGAAAEGTGAAAEMAGAAAERMRAAGKTAAVDKAALCSAWIQVLFAQLWPWLAPEKRDQSESMELTCRMIQYIMEHFQEPLTLETLARELHVNRYYVSNIFSGRLRTNFRRYLNHVRLEYAMQLMQTSSAPLIDIWAEAGFNSQRSFNRAFAEIMGMTPMEYRKSDLMSCHEYPDRMRILPDKI